MKSLLLVLFFWAAPVLAAWDLNDVSYLLPLPQQKEDSGLLKISAKGRGGELIPSALIEFIPFISFDMNRESTRESLRLLAVRIDPCFPLPTPQSCQRQIRLVWQPVVLTAQGEVQTVDAALHSFYVLSEQDWISLLVDLQKWKARYSPGTDSLPLQVHPAWQNEGSGSPSLKAFHQVITRYAGKENLTRVTAMLLRRGGLMWTFLGYSVDGDKLQSFEIPRLNGKKAQGFINLAMPPDRFSNGGISPFPRGEDIINTLVAGSDLLEAQDEDTIRREARAAFRIENPKAFNPENMDCASCHVAQPALHWVLNNRPQLRVEQLWSSEIYKNARYNLSNPSSLAANTQVIRAFGYFGADVAISQRVINESAEVADSLNQKH